MTSDVREQLVAIIACRLADAAADLVLERFDVTPKSVITDEALGDLVKEAAQWNGIFQLNAGQRMRKCLESQSLRIVSASE